MLLGYPLDTRLCCDVKSTSVTLIERRNNVVCPVGTAIIKILIVKPGDRLQTSESDVYRRQILTTEVDPRAVRVELDSVALRG